MYTGLAVENRYFGKRTFRFNRHLTSVVGNKDAGKSEMCAMMQSAVHAAYPLAEGRAALFLEKVVDGDSRYFAFYRHEASERPQLYRIDPSTGSAEPLDAEGNAAAGLQVKFYRADKIGEMIRSREKIDAFLKNVLGPPTRENLARFNTMFAIGRFLEKEKEPLLSVTSHQGQYRLHLNVNWRAGKERLRETLSLSYSMRRTSVFCIIVVMSEFGPGPSSIVPRRNSTIGT